MKKVININTLGQLAAELRLEGKKIILTNGCFDILHIGHARYLEKAKELGDILIIGINSDASVKRLKGSSRPLNNENDRAELISYLGFVDLVSVFTEDTADNLIKIVRPDIYVKGGDYTRETLPENSTLLEVGSDVAFISFVDGYSTTNIISKF